MSKKPILIVAGEPYSIFSEIFFKSYKRLNLKRPIVLIASKKIFQKQMEKLGYNYHFKEADKNLSKKVFNDRNVINIIDVKFSFTKTFDKISDNSNDYIDNCFLIANNLLKVKKAYALINGPISKKNFLKGKYLGITEYLSKMNKVKNFAMLIYNKNLSVSPITTHIALKNKKFKIEGPLAAESLFMKKNINRFDVVIGMYHDQVLTPIKTIHNFEAINITLGLPYIRISPDHGTNNLMLGKNKSDPTSLISAIKFLQSR